MLQLIIRIGLMPHIPPSANDGIGLVAKRLEHIPNSDPPRVRTISDNRWFAREM